MRIDLSQHSWLNHTTLLLTASCPDKPRTSHFQIECRRAEVCKQNHVLWLDRFQHGSGSNKYKRRGTCKRPVGIQTTKVVYSLRQRTAERRRDALVLDVIARLHIFMRISASAIRRPLLSQSSSLSQHQHFYLDRPVLESPVQSPHCVVMHMVVGC